MRILYCMAMRHVFRKGALLNSMMWPYVGCQLCSSTGLTRKGALYEFDLLVLLGRGQLLNIERL